MAKPLRSLPLLGYMPSQGDVLDVLHDSQPQDRAVFVRTKDGRRPSDLCGVDRANVPAVRSILVGPFDLVGDSYASDDDDSTISCSIDWTSEYDLEFTVARDDVWIDLPNGLEQRRARAKQRRLIVMFALGLWLTGRQISPIPKAELLQEASVFLDAAFECRGWDEAFLTGLEAPSVYRDWPRLDAISAGQLDRVTNILTQARTGGCAAGKAAGTHVEIPNWEGGA